jgi:pimeloyl-ACP methyl ester carboxylesterase
MLQREELALPTGVVTYFVSGNGRPLLYVHGEEGPRISETLESLAGERRLYIPVLPGFDGTPLHDGVRSVRDLGSLLSEFTEKAIGEPCDVISHCFGGWVAMSMAVQSPASADHLVLMAPMPFPQGDGASLNELNRSGAGDHALQRVSLAGTRHEAVGGNRSVVARYVADTTVDDLIAALPSMKSVTLLLVGSSAAVDSIETARRLRSNIPRCHLLYIHDTGHFAQLDQPIRCKRAVSDFLNWGEAFLVNRADQRVPVGSDSRPHQTSLGNLP